MMIFSAFFFQMSPWLQLMVNETNFPFNASFRGWYCCCQFMDSEGKFIFVWRHTSRSEIVWKKIIKLLFFPKIKSQRPFKRHCFGFKIVCFNLGRNMLIKYIFQYNFNIEKACSLFKLTVLVV